MMNIQATSQLTSLLPGAGSQSGGVLNAAAANRPADDAEVHELFNQFVGETFFSQLIKSMRSTVDKPAYFHGGRAEEVFQGQMDQLLSEKMAETSADQFAAPMYELFKLQRS